MATQEVDILMEPICLIDKLSSSSISGYFYRLLQYKATIKENKCLLTMKTDKIAQNRVFK